MSKLPIESGGEHPLRMNQYGDLKNGDLYLDTLQQIAKIRSIQAPFWERPQDEPPKTFEWGTYTIRIGPIDGFPHTEAATIAVATVGSYVDQDVYDHSPDTHATRLAAMIQRLNTHQYVVSLQKDDMAVSGRIVSPGRSTKFIPEILGEEATVSTLHYLVPGTSLPQLANIEERQVIAFGGRFRLPDIVQRRGMSDDEYTQFLKLQSMLTNRACIEAIRILQNKNRPISYMIFDTPDPRVVETMTQHYASQIILQGLESILYGEPTVQEDDKTSWIGMSHVSDLFHIADQIDTEIGALREV